ncbi:MAG: TIGR02757 family protein [Flavobacteriales bacterium]|nr:TIGR02757 family protein [Flavobacteriales bacterium]
MARRTPIHALKPLLDEAYERHAHPGFIHADPIHIPKGFADRRDAELIGFLVATIAWGQRKTIIANARTLVRLMDEAPHDFVTNASDTELERLQRFVHRTFNGTDLGYFIRALRHLYTTYGGLEEAFMPAARVKAQARSRANATAFEAKGPWLAAEGIALFKERFFEIDHPARTRKHVADPAKGSNAKRINMYLRWMVRPNDRGVDLGLWQRITPADLMVPLDVHTGRVARELGLLKRTQDDWKAVEELTTALRQFDPLDPVKYDIALFGIGVNWERR